MNEFHHELVLLVSLIDLIKMVLPSNARSVIKMQLKTSVWGTALVTAPQPQS